ncbi:hypothetical protein ALT1644_440001 [Alteromonas macleodii]|tara:strand:+ start:851 stop:1177 length:327 start_codon:yes stop_codon:yes gene_type:complete
MSNQSTLTAIFLEAQSEIEKKHDQVIGLGRPPSAPAELATYMLSVGDMKNHNNPRIIATLDDSKNEYHINWGTPSKNKFEDKSYRVNKAELTTGWLVEFVESNLLSIE